MFNLASNIQGQPESLAHTLRYLRGKGTASMKEAAGLLRSGKRVVITGMGASLFASIPLQYHLCSLGIDAVAIEAGELLHYLEHAWRDAVVLIVSRSGESVEIAKLLEKMKGSVPIISVTNVPESLLSRSADVSLHIASLQDQIVAIQTYTGTILALHVLGTHVDGTFESAIEAVQQLLPTFALLVEGNMKSLAQWDSFFTPHASLYLLARGSSLASAYEGSLLFHEVAKNPAVAMPVASFRHGPVEVVDPRFRGFVFAPLDATSDLNRALADDLVHFGGLVRLVGPAPEASQKLQWCNIPSVVPASLVPLFQIVPLQAAAYRLAELNGIEPGSFRFAPQVAVNESSFS